jgi:tripartite-type tricarboxylate transporter receptor subunit TctC
MAMRSRLMILGGSLLLALAATDAQAQAPYPERTVRLVVPNPPGGVTDLLARIIAQRLSATWGQAVVVDNRPGGDETIAAESVARAAPDGHTLFVASGAPLVAAPHLHKDIRYDPLKDF